MAASTVATYRNSDSHSSEKAGKFFSRIRLENLFENCDLRPHHANMIAAMWRAAGKPQGNEILLFAAVEGYRIEARYRSRRAVQYNLRALEAIGVIELAKGANTVRRPATYRLRTDQLGKRQTYADVKRRKAPHSISDSTSPATSLTNPVPAPQAAAATPPPTAAAAAVPIEIRSRKLTRDEKAALVRIFTDLRRPIKETLQAAQPPPDPKAEQAWSKIKAFVKAKLDPHRFETWLRPTSGDSERDGVLYVRVPDEEFLFIGRKFETLFAGAIAGLGLPYAGIQFLAPPAAKHKPRMPAADALRKACEELRITVEDGAVALKIAGFDVC